MRYIIFILFIGLSFCADAQKRVVIEKFTNSSCGVCPNASLILEDIISRYDNVIWVSHYKNNGWFDNPLTNDQTAQLWSDLDVPGNPLGMIDRIPDDSFPFFVSNAWENRILELLGEEEISTVTIKNVNYNLASRLISFDTEVLFLENMSAGDRVTPVFVEENKTGFAIQSHYMYQATKWLGVGAHAGIGLDVNSYIEAPVLLFGASISLGNNHQFIIDFGLADGKRRVVPDNIRNDLINANLTEIPEIYNHTEFNTEFYIGVSYRIF
jgi:hypothetical protein